MEEYKRLNEYLNETIKNLARELEDKNIELRHLREHLEIQANLITELKRQISEISEFKL